MQDVSNLQAHEYKVVEVFFASLNMTVTAQTITYTNPEITSERPGNKVVLPYGFGPVPADMANKRIFYFDIDNCLYKRSTGVHEKTQVLIHKYFKDRLKLNDEDAHNLHMKYYQVYGLAVEGLVRKHGVDALEYNEKVDDALDLKPILHYDEALREMLIRLRPHYDIFWLITNAYKNHAIRVVSFLGIGDLFEGLTFCDYSKQPIVCKPMPGYFYNTFHQTNIDWKSEDAMRKQTFIDDSEINVKAAYKLGMGTVIQVLELDADYEKLVAKPDFEQFYGKGDNTDPSKILLIRDIAKVEGVLQNLSKILA